MFFEFKKIVALLLLFVVLAANTGFVVVKHFCKFRGQHTSFFHNPSKNSCCLYHPKTKKTSFEAPKCCFEHVNLYKSNITLYSFQVEMPAFTLICVFTLSFTSVVLFQGKAQNSVAIYPNPPPIAGKMLLSYFCLYKI